VQVYKIEFEHGDPLYCDGVQAHTTTSSLFSCIDPDQVPWFIYKPKKLRVGDKLITRDGYRKIKAISVYSTEKVAEIFLEKNHGYIVKGCKSFVTNKNMSRAIPNLLSKYGITGKKETSIFKHFVIPFSVHFFKIVALNIKSLFK
jgi:hypothetical protein